jgi:DNA-binding beta-propeller fold protein YncE
MPKTPRGIVGNTPDIGYWLDGDNNAILKIDKDGNLLLQWGKKGSEDGQLNLPARYVPQGMAIDNQNRLFVADTLNNRVQVFNTEGKFLAKWGSQGKADGQFSNPESILVAPDGNVYVADENRIQKFDSNGTFLFKFATKGSDEGQVVGQVYQMDNDLNGNIYILDQMNKSLMKFDNTGKFMVKFGGLGEADGSFMMPFSEAVDAQGNIYVADYTLQTIQKFDTNGKFAGKWLVKDTAGKPLVPVWLTIDKAKAQITVATSNSGPTLTYKLP